MSSLRIPFLVLMSLLLVESAMAAGKAVPATRSYGTRDQLRACLDLDDALDARWQAIESAAAEHDRKFDANEAEDAQLVKMKASLDRNDKTAISAFNQAVADHNLHIQQSNQEAAAAEATSRAYAADRAVADGQCGNLTYRPSDIDAENKERRKPAAVAAAASAP